jgi:thiol-disulfide isomerase/thioredoxin
MPGSTNTNRRHTLFITMFAVSVFILDAGLLPLLVKSQQVALNNVAPILPPPFIELSAPKLELTDLQGTRVSTESYRGKVVLVNNWATGCPPCEVERPE